MTSDLVMSVTESSGVAEARRAAADLAIKLGFGETEAGKLALVVTELGTNLAKHAKAGRIVLRQVNGGTHHGVDVLALDEGPGIANVAQCLRDGYSTSGSPGSGLGAIQRQADEFDIHSLPDVGTAILARLWAAPSVSPKTGLYEVGTLCVPKAGETVCGDGWIAIEQPTRLLLLLADGLGHGPSAAEAAWAAVDIAREHATLSLTDLMHVVHPALRATRGAAVALAAIDHRKSVVDFVGMGNIAGRIVSPQGDRSVVSLPGTVGIGLRKVTPFAYPWSNDSLLVLHSDGLTTRWGLARYPGLALRHPSLIAGVLFRDHSRGYDDVTVLVVRKRT
jgi:anti-sigma regulatory factor (Ser/Thr protein kinase)